MPAAIRAARPGGQIRPGQLVPGLPGRWQIQGGVQAATTGESTVIPLARRTPGEKSATRRRTNELRRCAKGLGELRMKKGGARGQRQEETRRDWYPFDAMESMIATTPMARSAIGSTFIRPTESQRDNHPLTQCESAVYGGRDETVLDGSSLPDCVPQAFGGGQRPTRLLPRRCQWPP